MTKNLSRAYTVAGLLGKGDRYLSNPMSIGFEDYMDDLTLYQGINGLSLEDLQTKVEWANSYGAELYKNNVEITDDERHAFGEAYRKQFELEND